MFRQAAFVAVTISAAFFAGPALAETAPAADGSGPLTARDAGVRYGQAAGVAAVCENVHATEKAQQLIQNYSGADLDTFKVQADAVLAAWKKTLSCENAGDPNQCRLAHQISCGEAYKEIGPEGKVMPGLVEHRKPVEP
jgi:hypothetical protein